MAETTPVAATGVDADTDAAATRLSRVADLPRWELVAALSMVGIGLVVRLWPRGPLWLDEALSVNIARLPFDEMGAALKQDGHPPLYYALLHLWTSLAGTSTSAVRALSILVSCVGFPLVWVVARRSGGNLYAMPQCG